MRQQGTHTRSANAAAVRQQHGSQDTPCRELCCCMPAVWTYAVVWNVLAAAWCVHQMPLCPTLNLDLPGCSMGHVTLVHMRTSPCLGQHVWSLSQSRLWC